MFRVRVASAHESGFFSRSLPSLYSPTPIPQNSHPTSGTNSIGESIILLLNLKMKMMTSQLSKRISWSISIYIYISYIIHVDLSIHLCISTPHVSWDLQLCFLLQCSWCAIYLNQVSEGNSVVLLLQCGCWCVLSRSIYDQFARAIWAI